MNILTVTMIGGRPVGFFPVVLCYTEGRDSGPTAVDRPLTPRRLLRAERGVRIEVKGSE